MVAALPAPAEAPARPGETASSARAARAAAFPPRARIRAVRRYLAHRGAAISWALIDTRGRVRGFHPRRTFVSASVVKAMLLVSYLRKLGRRGPSAADRSLLGPMITASDNDRADSVYFRVGDPSLYALARRARMRSFSVAGYWANARFSALDQARFFRRLPRLVPRRSRGYARRLLRSVVPWQTWGFARVARRHGFSTFFKGGWRSTSAGRLLHEAAWFEHGRIRFSMALLSDANPSHEYGTETLRGVARRVFGVRARRAASTLHDVHDFAPGIRVDLAYRTRRNLTGRRLPGYCANRALMLAPAARDLARAQRWLRRRGLGLLILDSYRPARASQALVRWAERSGRSDLVGTYIARRSRHNTGGAVDITLVRLRDGKRLRMGSGYDELGPRAHTLNARGRVLHNRLTLRRALERFGFADYWREWWHFEHRSALGAPLLDRPIGCDSR